MLGKKRKELDSQTTTRVFYLSQWGEQHLLLISITFKTCIDKKKEVNDIFVKREPPRKTKYFNFNHLLWELIANLLTTLSCWNNKSVLAFLLSESAFWNQGATRYMHRLK